MQVMVDWSVTIMRYITLKQPEFKLFSETAISSFQKMTEYDSSKFNGLKAGVRDINQMAKTLRSNEYSELNDILTAKFGRNLLDFKDKDQVVLSEILKKGAISSIGEYELVKDRVDLIYSDKFKINEFAKLNKMLLHFKKTLK